MPLKALLDTLDGLADDLRTLYVPGNPDNEALKGKFILDVESSHGFVLDNVEALRNAFGKTKEELATTKQALEGFKGLSASKVRDSLKELEKLKAIDPENEADKLARSKIANAMEKAEVQHNQEIKEATAEVDRLWGALNTTLVANEVKDAIIAEGGSPDLLMPHVTGRVKVDRRTLKVSVFGKDGAPQYRVAGNDVQPAGISDLIAELKASEALGRAFAVDKPNSASNGSSRAYGPEPTSNPFAAASYNLTEQCRIMKADPARAAHLKAAAAGGAR